MWSYMVHMVHAVSVSMTQEAFALQQEALDDLRAAVGLAKISDVLVLAYDQQAFVPTTNAVLNSASA